jgi:flavorubredoxin
MDIPFSPIQDLVVLPSFEPVPGLGILPVNRFLTRGSELILVDTGVATERAAFLDALDTVMDPRDLRWILLTHEDADHAGALEALLERAPRPR